MSYAYIFLPDEAPGFEQRLKNEGHKKVYLENIKNYRIIAFTVKVARFSNCNRITYYVFIINIYLYISMYLLMQIYC